MKRRKSYSHTHTDAHHSRIESDTYVHTEKTGRDFSLRLARNFSIEMNFHPFYFIRTDFSPPSAVRPNMYLAPLHALDVYLFSTAYDTALASTRKSLWCVETRFSTYSMLDSTQLKTETNKIEYCVYSSSCRLAHSSTDSPNWTKGDFPLFVFRFRYSTSIRLYRFFLVCPPSQNYVGHSIFTFPVEVWGPRAALVACDGCCCCCGGCCECCCILKFFEFRYCDDWAHLTWTFPFNCHAISLVLLPLLRHDGCSCLLSRWLLLCQ